VAEDGLYSARLTSYPAVGRYTFRILVEGQPEATLVPPMGLEAGSDRLCCGQSARLLATGRLVPTADFSRSVAGPVVHIGRLPDLRRIPPGKVNDLSIDVIEDDEENDGDISNSDAVGRGQLAMTWTSPGGDFSLGSVASCRVVYSENISDLLDPTVAPDLLTVIGRADLQPAGLENRRLIVDFPHRGRDFYLGVVCLDAEGNRGRMSNLVSVFLPVVADVAGEAGAEGSEDDA